MKTHFVKSPILPCICELILSGMNEKDTYTQIIYQLIFATKNCEGILDKNNREELYKYINGILTNKNCKLYQIGGFDDHIHILFDLHPTVILSSLVQDIKVASGIYIRKRNLFPAFKGWQSGYVAFTYAKRDYRMLIEYILNQEEYHQRIGFLEEYILMLKEHGVEFDERYIP